MGPTATQVLWMRGGMGGVTVPNAIVAVDRSTDGKLLWTRKASDVPLPKRPAGDGSTRGIGFEGTPVADASGVYVAMTDRRELTATYVVCLDAETGARAGSATSAPPRPTPRTSASAGSAGWAWGCRRS